MEDDSILMREDGDEEGGGGGGGRTSAVPLMLRTTAYQDEKMRHKQDTLPNLPSHRFRYSVWHDLPALALTGDQLRAPRVRDGPPVKDEMFYKLRDDNNKRVHHMYRGKERKNYQDTTENWENAEHANLSYQELQHDYQKKNFLRVLRRLIRCHEIILIEDSLQQLQSVSFPCVTHLNLTSNHVESFKHLPKMPQIEFLILTNNVIKNMDGLSRLKSTKIKYLHLKGNPVAYDLNYRARVFSALPGLEVLDDINKQPRDDAHFFPDYNGRDQRDVDATKSRDCVVM